ncbi:MAG: ABC transporter substrate-binding protein [Bacillota bacterium]
MKKMLSLTTTILLTFSLLSCGNQTTEPTTAQATTSATRTDIIIANNAEGRDWDPIKGWGKTENPLMQSKLVNIVGVGEIACDLATDFHVNDDATVWTFHLRDDVQFSDGTDFTAADVVFTVETAKTAASVVDFTNVSSVTALDPYTVEFTLYTPASTFIYQMATLGILPAHAYDELTYAENPIGTGPYKMVQWDKGQQIILEQNPYYYGEITEIETIVMVFMDPTSALAAVQAGTVDVAQADIVTAEVPVEGYDLGIFATNENAGISLPYPPVQEDRPIAHAVGNDVTSDLALRQALSIAVDRITFAEDVLNGYAEPSYSIANGLLWEHEDTSFPDGQMDEALHILENGGWIDTDGDGIREKDGLRAEFDLYYPTGVAARQMIATGFSLLAKELGIQVNLVGGSWDEIFENYHANAFVVFDGSATPYTYYQSTTIQSAGVITSNMGFYHNETVEAYMSSALATGDLEEALDFWKKSQWDGEEGSSMLGDVPVVWLANLNHMYFVREGLDVGEQELHAHGNSGVQILSNIAEWSWK